MHPPILRAPHPALLRPQRPGIGDPFRSFEQGLYGPQFQAFNRSKKSITLDLKIPEAREIVYRIVPTVDVVVENFRPGAMEAMGIGYEDLRPLNEKLIYASGSAWGRNGPWARRGGYDHVADALVKKGVVSHRGEAFNTLLGSNGPAYVPRYAAPLEAMLDAFGGGRQAT